MTTLLAVANPPYLSNIVALVICAFASTTFLPDHFKPAGPQFKGPQNCHGAAEGLPAARPGDTVAPP
jgi:hypothetical protein